VYHLSVAWEGCVHRKCAQVLYCVIKICILFIHSCDLIWQSTNSCHFCTSQPHFQPHDLPWPSSLSIVHCRIVMKLTPGTLIENKSSAAERATTRTSPTQRGWGVSTPQPSSIKEEILLMLDHRSILVNIRSRIPSSPWQHTLLPAWIDFCV